MPISFDKMNLEKIRPSEYKELQKVAYANDLARLHVRLKEFVEVDCPACGASSADFKFEKYRCTFVECDSCHTIYMNPRPTPEIMDEYYSNSENYAIWNKYIFPQSEAVRRERISKPNLEVVMSECRKNGFDSPQLIEIGPGFGTFASLAKESNFFRSVAVVERNPEMAQACRAKGLSVFDGALESLDNSDGGLSDVAVCFEVIEHVFDPIEFLQSVNRLLRAGGLFIFTCPNGLGFDTAVLGAMSPAVDTEHVNLFNTDSIAVLLERAGFTLTSACTPGVLDVEIVRNAVLGGEVKLDDNQYLKNLLQRDSETPLADALQEFLRTNNLSGNMRIVARKTIALK